MHFKISSEICYTLRTQISGNILYASVALTLFYFYSFPSESEWDGTCCFMLPPSAVVIVTHVEGTSNWTTHLRIACSWLRAKTHFPTSALAALWLVYSLLGPAVLAGQLSSVAHLVQYLLFASALSSTRSRLLLTDITNAKQSKTSQF